MHVIVDFCLIPIGTELTLSRYIAKCQSVLKDFPVECTLHAYGTTIEGDWDEVMASIKACHHAVHQMGVVRISTSLKIGTRTDKEQSALDKINSVNTLLESQ